MMKRLLSAKAFDPFILTIFFVAYVFFFATANPLFGSNDTPWHIAAGNYILDTLTIPSHDPWSFTAGSFKWYNISWLWDVTIASIVRIDQSLAFYFGIALYAFLVTFLAYSLRYLWNFSREITTICTFITLVSIIPFIGIRPQIITYLFVIAFYALLSKRQISPSSYIVFPVLMLLWVNLHGGFVSGFIIIGAFILEAAYERKAANIRSLSTIGMLCGLATFCSPYGIYIIEAVYRTLGSSITDHILEWQPLRITSSLGSALFLATFLLIGHFSSIRLKVADLLLVFFWLFMGMLSSRHFPISVLIAAPYIAQGLSQYAAKLTPIPKMGHRLSSLGIVLGFCITAPLLPYLPLRDDDGIIKKEKLPLEALNYLKEKAPQGNLLNNYGYGGYVIYYLKDHAPFIDGRAGTAYPEEVLQDYMAFQKLEAGWQNILDKYDVRVILVNNASTFKKFYDYTPHTEWTLSFEGPIASVFTRERNDI